MHFGKFTAILKCFKCRYANIKRLKTTLNECNDLLMKHLDIPEEESINIANKYKLYNRRDGHLVETLSALKSLGYNKKEIHSVIGIITRSPKQIHEHYLLLKEAGFSNLNLLTLYNFRKLVNKKISVLKLMDLIPPHINVVETLIMHLHPKPVESFVDDLTEEDIFGQIHVAIVKRYLQWRLETTSDEIERIFRVYSGIAKYRSLQRLCENIEICLDLGFTQESIIRYGFLLFIDANNPKTVLEKMPNLAGADMRIMFRRYPKLLDIPPKLYTKIYKILKDEQIPDSAIQKQMNIFLISPDTITSRFEEIRNIPEMNVLRQSPRILRLIIHHNRARSRLSFMHELQLKCITMCLLEHDDVEYFERYVRNTKDVNVFNDIVRLLKHLLKSNAPEIEYNLKKHPYYLQVPLVNIERTCKYVQKSFSNSAIIKVVPIVLYPAEKIEAALKQISSMNDLPRERLTEAKKLNLVLYLIEKNTHFTGDGVWENSTTVPN